jgi:hypothetical protein
MKDGEPETGAGLTLGEAGTRFPSDVDRNIAGVFQFDDSLMKAG